MGKGKSGMHVMTDESSDFGEAGTYELYRVGGFEAKSGMAFFSASPAEVSLYAFARHKIKASDGNGYTLEDADSFSQYRVKLNNPLVVHESSDRNNVIAAWKKLHPGEDPKIKTNGLPAKKWQQMDKQNAKALVNSPYDAIIYKKDNGHHEVQIPLASIGNVKKTNTYKYSGQEAKEEAFGKGVYNSIVKGGGVQYWRFDKKKGFIKTKPKQMLEKYAKEHGYK